MEEFLKEHGFEYNSNDENLMEAKWDEDDSSYLADGEVFDDVDYSELQAALEGE